MDLTINKTAKVEINKEELITALQPVICKGELADYVITDVRDRQHTTWEPGADPHDAFAVETFDGLVISLKKAE